MAAGRTMRTRLNRSVKQKVRNRVEITGRRSHAKLDLLEVFAYTDSRLSHEWAKRGMSAVRIAHRTTGQPKKGPEPKKCRAVTWFLDLTQGQDRRLLLEYMSTYSPKVLIFIYVIYTSQGNKLNEHVYVFCTTKSKNYVNQ